MNSIEEFAAEIESWKSEMAGALQKLASIHNRVCKAAESREIRIEDETVDHSIWNNCGFFLLGLRMYSETEQVYQDMLDTILSFERQNKTTLHKGLALHNLGLAQFMQRKFDEAVPNILAAYQEDVRTFDQEKAKGLMASRFKGDLSNLIGDELDKVFLPSLLKHVNTIKVRSSSGLLGKLSENEFLLLGRITLTNKHHRFSDDMYGGIVRFDSLRDMCLLLDIYLKRKSQGTADLGPLIQRAFHKDRWLSVFDKYVKDRTHFSGATVPDAVAKFTKNLKFLDGNLGGSPEEEYLARCFLTTVLVRHFTAHYFDAYDNLMREEPLYRQTFERATASILYALERL